MTKFIEDRQIFEEVFLEAIPRAEEFVWIATADIKDLHIPGCARRSYSILKEFSTLIGKGISVRLIHAKEPGKNFRESFDKHPNLIDGLERALCPRNHMRGVIVDGKWCYLGTANLTGAGMGAKSKKRRNFEAGIVSSEAHILEPLMTKFDELWMVNH